MLPDEPDRIAVACESLTALPEKSTNGCLMGTCPDTYLGEAMRDFMAITKALADENRVRMLLALRRKELCVCQLIELARLAPSTVSKHMSILKQARLVDSRKDGRWMYYRLAGAHAPPAVRQAIEWVSRSLAADPQMAVDGDRLDEILKLDPQDLCGDQCSSRQHCGESAPQRVSRRSTEGRVRVFRK